MINTTASLCAKRPRPKCVSSAIRFGPTEKGARRRGTRWGVGVECLWACRAIRARCRTRRAQVQGYAIDRSVYFTGRRRRRRRLLGEWVGGAVPSRTRRRRRPYSSRRVPLPPPGPHQRAPPNRTQWRTLACGRETGSLWSWTAYARSVSSGKCRRLYAETWSHRAPAVLLPRDITYVHIFFKRRRRSLVLDIYDNDNNYLLTSSANSR